MILCNPAGTFASTHGYAEGLTVMTQEYDAKDIKGDGWFQFGGQVGVVGSCSAYAGNDTRNALDNGLPICARDQPALTVQPEGCGLEQIWPLAFPIGLVY